MILIGLLVYCVTVAANIIIEQPKDAIICKNKWATFTVTVSDPTSAIFQWYIIRPGQTTAEVIPLANQSSYMANERGIYYCWVRTSSGEEESNRVTLEIIGTPILGRINVPEICDGEELHAAVTSVDKNGSDLTAYEWKLNGIVRQSGTLSSEAVPDLLYYADASQSGGLLVLTVTNGCGPDSTRTNIVVNPTPEAPSLSSGTQYCQGDEATPLTIVQNNQANWYTQATGGVPGEAPTPDTEVFTPQIWWVSQTINYSHLSCESHRTQVTVNVRQRSALPQTEVNVDLCLDDQNKVLSAQGENLRWFGQDEQSIPNAPQITTTDAGTQIFYVTQTESGKCESLKQKITVRIRERASAEIIQPDLFPQVCPYTRFPIEIWADGDVTNPIFRWYKNNNKTGFIQEGNTFETPVLTSDTIYYVTLEYEGYCESIYSRALYLTVRDVERPVVETPADIVVSTNDGVCHATNVQTGKPAATDNCTPGDQLKIYNDPQAPASYPLGSTTIIWWVEDMIGNKDRVMQTITVKDTEFPKVNCPEDIEVIVNDDVLSAVVDYEFSYTDNCSAKTELKSGYESGSTFPLGETLVHHAVTDTAGNTFDCTFKVTVRHPNRPLNVALRVDSYELCPGEAITLSSVVSGGTGRYTYSWKPRAWTQAVLEDYPLATTTYELTVSDGEVSETKSVTITVLETTPVSLQYDGREDEILEGDEVVVKATDGFSSYKFLLNSEVMQEVGLYNQIAFMAQLGVYTVRVFATDANYCVSQDQLVINVESKKLPNVFTPNQDGKNEIFLEGYDLTVFSRTGELLYKGTNGWDGMYKGKALPQGTYLYVVRRTMINGEQRIYKGTVTIKR